jgi:Ca2+-transporting ATPase
VARERLAGLRRVVDLALDPMALMLVAAAGLYWALGQHRDALVMAVALGPVLAVDVILEARSRGALAALARRVAVPARVVRDGREQEVSGAALVPR